MNLICLTPVTIKNPHYGTAKEYLTSNSPYIQVPCGKCPACLMRRRNEWSFRIALESSISYNNYFFTLTYDEINEPWRESELYGFEPTHRYSDFQKFMHDLRRNLYGNKGGDLRFCVCSEYGPTTNRPHYHGILFNFPTERNCQYEVLRAWRFGVECTVGPLRDGGKGYVTKYMFAKQRYFYDDMTPNFFRCSQRPPLGAGAITERQIKFLIENTSDKFRSSVVDSFTLPRSFKNKFFDKSTLFEISQVKQAQFLARAEDEFSSLVTRLGDEYKAREFISRLNVQRWITLNNSINRTLKKSKI